MLSTDWNSSYTSDSNSKQVSINVFCNKQKMPHNSLEEDDTSFLVYFTLFLLLIIGNKKYIGLHLIPHKGWVYTCINAL